MPDVGVLQLKISADASAASKSLKTLQTRLSEINTLAQSFNVSNISTQIGNIVSTVKGDKGISTAVKNLGTLLNAIAAFGKVKNIGLTEEQVQRISSLQTAVSGFNLGQAGTQLNKLREALGGEWSTEQASKARDALETLSQGARAVSESGTAEKIKSVSKSIENIAGGTVGNIKGTTSDIVDYEKAVAEMGDTLKENQLIFNEPRRKLNLQFFGGKADNSGFAESTRQIKEVQSVATKAAGPVKQLIDTLNGQIDYKKGKLSDTINNSLGISKPAISDEAKNGMIGLWDSHIQRLDDLNHAADMMKRKLEAPIDYSNIQKYIDMVTGVSRITTQASQETTTAFNMPAMDQNGPFKYASDELVHYTEMLNKAKSDIEFWANEYASIQKRIRFNGATEERTAALGQAEQSFYAATQAADEYQARVSAVTEYINKFQEVKENIQQATAAKEEFARPEGWGAGSLNSLIASTNELGRSLRGLNGIQAQWQAIKDVSENTGLPIEEINKQIAQTREQSEGARKSIQEMLAALNQDPQKLNWAQSIDRMLGIGNAAKSAKESAQLFEQELTSGTSEAASQMRELTGTIQDQSDKTKSLAARFSELAFGTEGLKGSMSRMFPTISGLAKRFSSLIKYRMLRAVIKQISEGFREGYENYYHYSEAIGSSFAPSMDSAASSLLQMKNSIGAAVAPLMQSLVPVLQTVVNWFITAVNWANQFLALMRGQSTWSRAVPTTEKAFSKTEKAAKGASSAMKDLLADWDELNIIQSQGGGSGSGTGADAMTDYLNMFEEVSEFDNRVRDVFNYIKENMGDIARLAAEVGGAILGWKVSEAFGGILGKLGGVLGTLATIALTVELTDKFGKLYTSTGDVGWFFADALTGAVGSALAWKIAKRVGGGNFALEAGGFTLMLSGLVNLQNGISAGMQGKMAEFGMLSILSAAEAGVGAALIAKGLNLTTAFSFGLGFAAAIATVAIAIGAKIQMTKDNIKWGTVTLTREEIEKFVSQRMFNGLDVTATVNKINTDVSNVTINRKAIQDALADVRIPLNMIRLGIDKADSYEQLKKQIFGDEEGGTQGLISKIQAYAESNVQELKTAFSMVPVINRAGTDVSGKYLTSGIEGWSQVQSYMNWLGGELGKELSKGFTEDGIAKFDEDAVREMTEKIRRISEIITGSQAQAAAQSDLRLGLSELGLGDLDQSSVDQVIALFGNYQTQLRDAYENIYKDAAGQFLVLANYYREQGNETLAADYETQYRELMAMLPDSVNNAVKNASGSGMEMIYEFLHSKFGDVFNRLMLNLDDGGSGVLRQIMLSKFTPTAGDAEKSKKEFNDALLSIYGGENMFLAGLLSHMPGISMIDLITFGMDEKDKNEAINNLKEMVTSLYGEELTDTLFPKIEVDVPTDLNPTPDSGDRTYDVEYDDSGITDPQSVPAPNLSDYMSGLAAMTRQTKSAVDYVKSELNSINGMSVDVRVHAPSNNGGGFSGGVKYYQRAEGGFVRSGDLVMANENGQFEMMGKFGHQPAVANNEQIVTGISRGVSVANDGVVSALNVLIGLAQRIERKELVAKVVPGTGIGRVNQQSADMFSRVTGV